MKLVNNINLWAVKRYTLTPDLETPLAKPSKYGKQTLFLSVNVTARSVCSSNACGWGLRCQSAVRLYLWMHICNSALQWSSSDLEWNIALYSFFVSHKHSAYVKGSKRSPTTAPDAKYMTFVQKWALCICTKFLLFASEWIDFVFFCASMLQFL